MFLAQRRLQPEVMDQPDLEVSRHVLALKGLARLNQASGSANILWRELAQLARTGPSTSLRLLDLATGSGDIPVALWHRARRQGWDWDIVGFDFSPVAVEQARQRAAHSGASVRFLAHDVLSGPLTPKKESDSLPARYDTVMCSLFLHHLTEETAIDLLQRMAERTDQLVLVNDLRRHWWGLMLAHVFSRLLSSSRVVHTDGPRSVEGAFTLAEARSLAERAGLHDSTVVPRWPCRWLLRWRKS